MSAPVPVTGLHHVTAICGPPQPSIDFYCGLLGLRLVKRTVNFDDPGTYHLYYGDGAGRPGSVMTVFPWPDGMRGRPGAGSATATAYAVPRGSLDYWMGRFADLAVDFDAITQVGGEPIIAIDDPDGIRVELVEWDTEIDAADWDESPVPQLHAIRGFHGVTLSVVSMDATARVLEDVMGYHATGGDGSDTVRFKTPESGLGSVIELRRVPSTSRTRMGVGVVHHVAFRAPDDATQEHWREALVDLGFSVSPVRDRQYFKSIYFREPGGVLFEIATDQPGFDRDEPMDQLGQELKLPPWLEHDRGRIERQLPRIEPPEARR